MLSMLFAALVALAQGPSSEQLIFVNREMPINSAGVSVLSELRLDVGSRVTSLTVAVAPLFARARDNVVRFWIDGQRQEVRLSTGRIEFIQVPVFATVGRNSRWIVSADSPATLYGVGATFEGSGHLPPPPSGPECTLLGYGQYAGFMYHYRIAVGSDGKIMDASDNLDSALEKMRTMMSSGVCRSKWPSAAKLGGYGAYRGFMFHYRLGSADGVLVGTDSFDTMVSNLEKLRNHGVLSDRVPSHELERCEMDGYGAYRGFMFRYRVKIGSDIVSASDNLQEATGRMEALRRLTLCF